MPADCVLDNTLLMVHDGHMTTTTAILSTVASDLLTDDRVYLGGAWRTVRYVVPCLATRETTIVTADGGSYVLTLDAPVSVYAIFGKDL